MGDRQGVRDHHSLTPQQDRGGNPLTGSLPPFVSSCADPHRDGETGTTYLRLPYTTESPPPRVGNKAPLTPTLGSSPLTRGKWEGIHPPTSALGSSPLTWGKDQDGIRPRLWQSGHPHQGGEVRVVVLMVAPAWWGCEFWGP